ncbi:MULTISPECIES: hypothetical protein [unclassified Streptomyces]|uniref:hypothetical protein n=1 Tax=unclassified Streptomyces TaxID=2593676 RepID=UPI00364C4611
MEAEREGWLGESLGLRVSLVGAQPEIDQIASAYGRMAIKLGMPRKAPAQTAPRRKQRR